ncbi:DNA ligase 4 [Cytospora mali]|uniref:DNA ligase n=1 Tax=Cytospora mali TaxID=578113 RepID=A0A194VNV0_CYTMA|nr:DNA ligase 4 [Valsa mali]
MRSQIKRPSSPSDSAKEEEERMYTNGPESLDEINEKYPLRPHNHSRTLPFSDLFNSLFNPLTKGGPTGPTSRARGGSTKVSPAEQRRQIIERFFSRWRNEVGNDIYPAMRLILPDIDRERPMYRLKEQAIGKLLVKIMRISPSSDDAKSLINWKVPGKTVASRMAGDFAGRCFEAIKKRPLRTEQGDMRIGDVNVLLDKLAVASGESEQLPIFEEFYRRMNPEEMQWLIRIILRQMKIGATEKTMLNAWHEDGSALYNVSSSLRHVCWDLWDPDVRIEEEKKQLSIMSNFQPQLAHFSVMALTWDKMVSKLGVGDGGEFWMEEKLDGERMQLHMQEDDSVPGGFKFGFWSRRAKDYTYLYGSSFEDDQSALTRHLKGAFHEGVWNCILDGEMIAFDPKVGKMVSFGTLKTSALQAQKNPYDEQGWRPLFRVFDMLYLNDEDLCNYELRDRRNSLQKVIKDVPGRFEIHQYRSCTSPFDIEPYLREIVQDSSEGLVLKNPGSPYVLNDRNWSWIKVKPEYMTEFGENLDCVIIGGYYGTGRRGGTLSSFLCGLRAGQHDIKSGAAGPEKFYSFFKVGGGLKTQDYREIERLTEGKWHDWDPKNASKYMELADGERYHEKPDVWIRPSESVVIEVKAASVEESISFKVGQTLRFPRFRSIRTDKSWDDALDIDQWQELHYRVKEEVNEKKEMAIEERRQKRAPNKRQKRELTIAGDAEFVTVEKSKVFEGKTFYVPGGSQNPKKTKAQLENLAKEHGAAIVQNPRRVTEGIAIALADRANGHVTSLKNKEGVNIITPKWLLDCIRQECLVPYEESHLYHATDNAHAIAAENTDKYGDSYFRDVDVDELREIFSRMKEIRGSDGTGFDKNAFYDQLEAQGHDLPRSKGYVFRKFRIFFAPVDGVSALTMARLVSWVRFGSGEVAEDLDDGAVTHVVVVSHRSTEDAGKVAADVRSRISRRDELKIPYIVTERWLEDCWKEETPVNEAQYVTT